MFEIKLHSHEERQLETIKLMGEYRNCENLQALVHKLLKEKIRERYEECRMRLDTAYRLQKKLEELEEDIEEDFSLEEDIEKPFIDDRREIIL